MLEASSDRDWSICYCDVGTSDSFLCHLMHWLTTAEYAMRMGQINHQNFLPVKSNVTNRLRALTISLSIRLAFRTRLSNGSWYLGCTVLVMAGIVQSLQIVNEWHDSCHFENVFY